MASSSNMPSFPQAKPPKEPDQPKVPKKKGRPKKVTEFRCYSCGTKFPKQDGNFLTSSSFLFEANNGYTPICKSCAEKYYLEKLLPAFEYDEARAIEVMCAIFDWYYSPMALDLSKKAQAAQPNGVLCSIYSGRRRMTQIKCRGTTYMDTIMQRREAASKISTLEEASGQSVDPDANHVEIPEYIFKMFGPGYTPDEYEYLQEQYEDWLAKYEVNTKALEQCIQALCVSTLNIRRAQQSNDQKATQAAMKSYQEMLTTARLSPKQHKEETVSDEETFGTLIQKWENEKPIPQPEKEFADVDGIKKLVTVFFFGHLCKMFNLKNDYADLYEEEIGKYTVTKPQGYDRDDDTDFTDALFRDAREVQEVPSEYEDGGR